MDNELITKLCQERVELGEALEFAAEIGDKIKWQQIKAEMKQIEDQIFNLTGQRPPYCGGWGSMGSHL